MPAIAFGLRRYFRFGIVGIAATLTHYLVLILLVELGDFHPTIVTPAAFLVATAVSYVLNRSWTFKVRGRHTRQFPRFVVGQTVGLLLNTGLMWFVYDLMNWHYQIAVAISVVIVPPITFWLQSEWTFDPVRPASLPDRAARQGSAASTRRSGPASR